MLKYISHVVSYETTRHNGILIKRTRLSLFVYPYVYLHTRVNARVALLIVNHDVSETFTRVHDLLIDNPRGRIIAG